LRVGRVPGQHGVQVGLGHDDDVQAQRGIDEISVPPSRAMTAACWSTVSPATSFTRSEDDVVDVCAAAASGRRSRDRTARSYRATLARFNRGDLPGWMALAVGRFATSSLKNITYLPVWSRPSRS
jgi:hypothetical protein